LHDITAAVLRSENITCVLANRRRLCGGDAAGTGWRIDLEISFGVVVTAWRTGGFHPKFNNFEGASGGRKRLLGQIHVCLTRNIIPLRSSWVPFLPLQVASLKTGGI
jgi:hypothetical protein